MKLPGSATTRTLYVPATSGGVNLTVTTPLPPTRILSRVCVAPIGTGRPELTSSNCTDTSLATTSPSLRTTAWIVTVSPTRGLAGLKPILEESTTRFGAGSGRSVSRRVAVLSSSFDSRIRLLASTNTWILRELFGLSIEIDSVTVTAAAPLLPTPISSINCSLPKSRVSPPDTSTNCTDTCLAAAVPLFPTTARRVTSSPLTGCSGKKAMFLLWMKRFAIGALLTDSGALAVLSSSLLSRMKLPGSTTI